MQGLIIGTLFSGALFYLGRLFYKSFTDKKSACGGACGCSKIDLEKIERRVLEGKEIQ